MFSWQMSLRIFLGIITGLATALILHACQAEPNALNNGSNVPSSAEANKVAVVSKSQDQPQDKPKKTELPPATKAIVDSVPNGLYDPPRGDIRLAVISDLNSSYGSTDYEPEVDKGLSLLPFWQPDMVVCSGDMVAGQYPSLTEDQIKAMWAAFDDRIAAPLRKAKLPYGFTVGNHDASSARGISGKFLFARDRDVASKYWNAPAHDPGVEFVDRFEFPFYYTFKYKDVFFLTWDGSSDLIPKDKLEWVEKSLQSPAAKAAKIKILLGHLPLYAVTVGRDEPGEVMANTEQLRAMLERNNVHTYISGHDHGYYPAHKGKLQLLHTGLLGSGPRPYIGSNMPPRKTMTIMDINFSSPELTTYTTYDMKTMQKINYNELPKSISAHNGIVLRRDVKMEDLSASERSNCESRLGANLCSA
ncbi:MULTISPECIES: metallophosphoesterase family protein [Pseudanabaena]|uniref:Metallophosphoesterase n=2 Tax=Pseudanabaena TaxID=1152 RepID=L8N7R2_9CYAN|nr:MULTISPECIES: metallophosphoesterase [Pseudanabaena]ELS34263.1 metallophosphoesterase [Pseudanabaena biceps PCC 7429]MDG3493560.1 metallophosphoesterase [Pseudanabaena catenata USMAC16]